jgi:hypothetical protein
LIVAVPYGNLIGMLPKLDPQQDRAFFDSAFEPHGGEFLYFGNRWARGVVVTAAEREAYLALPLLSKFIWSRRIRRRPRLHKRRSARATERMLAALPKAYPAALLGLALLVVREGVLSDSWLGPWVSGVSAIFLVLSATWLYLWHRRRG